MKLFPYFVLAGIAAFSSCNHEPIYYQAPSSSQPLTETPVASPTSPTLQGATTSTIAKPTTSAPKGLPKNNSPFLQPDVYSLPTQDDLKETSSATRKIQETPGLTVPRR